MTILSRIAGAASAFFFAAALFYAPMAYGCTRPETLPALFDLLALAMATGLLSFAIKGRRPILPGLPLIYVLLILLQGWWMTWLPVFPSIVPMNGALVDATLEHIRQLSFDSMLATSLLLGSFVILYGLLGDARPRRFILLTAALSGVLISMIGIILKLAGEPLMRYFWRPPDIDWNDFAFYRYHGNAGAFLNLVWPLILVFCRRAYSSAFRSPEVGFTKRILWTLAAVACGGALVLNASKASLVIGLLILPWPFLSWLMRLPRKTLLALGAVTVLLIAASLLASAYLAQEAAFERMTNSSSVSASLAGRMEAYQNYLDALPAAGFFGIGPGLFQLAFPYESSPLGNIAVGLREYAHEDYLQSILEWGWLGSLWWFLLIAGGLYQAIKTYRRRELFTSKTDRHFVLAVILGVCATLVQALIDFPLQIASIRLFFFLLLAFCWMSPQLLNNYRGPRSFIDWAGLPRLRLIRPSSRWKVKEFVKTNSR